MHINSILLFKRYALKYFKDDIKVLEIGPDSVPSSYSKCVNKKRIKWDTLDLVAGDNITYIANYEYSYPIEDNYYDIILSCQVIEHVRKIWRWIKELSRICKVGGYLIIINPVSWPFHQLPFDCWRIYPEGMKALYEEARLNVLLSISQSLEEIELRKNGVRKIIHGRSAPPEAYMSFLELLKNFIKRRKTLKLFTKGLLFQIKKIIGWPISCSIDTITIGFKK